MKTTPIMILARNKLIVTEIPYSKNTNTIISHPSKDREYYCSLDKSFLDSCTETEALLLKRDLELIASGKMFMHLEMYLSETAIDRYGNEVIVCYFKERVFKNDKP